MKDKDREIQRFMLRHPLKFAKWVRDTYPILCMGCKLKIKRYNWRMPFSKYCAACKKLIEGNYNDWVVN